MIGRVFIILALPIMIISQPSRSVKGSAQSNQDKGWHGIVPLHATRRDVERLLGSPHTPRGSSYETANENVYIAYSDGPCEKGWPYGWNVATDVVVSTTVSPKQKISLADLNINLSRYRSDRDSHISSTIYYNNGDEGVQIETNEISGTVTMITYGPPASARHLQCPDARGRLPAGRRQADSFFKFDAYGDISVAPERERLDALAGAMQRQPDSDGYIIAYAGKIAVTGEAKARAQCARSYLVRHHRIKAGRVVAIDGGYSEFAEVELYVEPHGGPFPLAIPSVRPSKVKIISGRKPATCKLNRAQDN